MDHETRAFFQQIVQRFDQIDNRFDQIDNRFDSVEQRLDKLEHRMDIMEVKQDRMKDQLEELQLSQKMFEGIAKKNFTRLQDGIDAIEEILRVNELIPR